MTPTHPPDGRAPSATPTVHARPRGRPRGGGALNEERIVGAGLDFIRRAGLNALSMRQLSREMGVSTMAIYNHVRNKQELLDLMAARALSDVDAIADCAGSWDQRLRLLVDRVDERLRLYEGVGEVLLDRMQSTERHVMRAMMEILDDAGFDDAQISLAYATVHTFLFGRVQNSIMGRPIARAELPPEGIVARIAPAVNCLRAPDFYRFGIETIIAGLRDQLHRQQQPTVVRDAQRQAKRSG